MARERAKGKRIEQSDEVEHVALSGSRPSCAFSCTIIAIVSSGGELSTESEDQ